MKIVRRLLTTTALFIATAIIFTLSIHASIAQTSIAQATQESCIDFSVRSQQIYNTAMISVTQEAFRNFDEETFITDQIIIGGPSTDVDKILEELAAKKIGLVSANRAFSVTGQLIQLFELRQGREEQAPSVRQVLCEIDALKSASTISNAIFAEPNYKVSAAPWWAGGSQWRDDASGFGYYTERADATIEQFQQQWIWGSQGISLTVDGSRTISTTGAGIKVAVFDTSPIVETGRFSYTLADGTIPLAINIASGAFSVTTPFDEGDAFADHGPFVSSLIHEVAPSAEIDLVPVLNNISGTMDLFTVSQVVNTYVTQEFSRTNSLAGTVLNFSLGVHHPLTKTIPSLGPTDTFGFPAEVLTLKTVLRNAHDAGAVIIAAAGNDFAFGDENSPYMEAPASYDFVIGVGGSTGPTSSGMGRSCFSNNGDVFAPGGNSGEDDCFFPPNESACQDDNNLTLCIVGLTHTQTISDSNASFRTWVGSSFAAPQVSGLAALILAEQRSDDSGSNNPPSPAEVRATIECGAGESRVNVINIARSLSPDCMPEKPDMPDEDTDVSLYLPLAQN